MKKLLILSGKGGTGKTTTAAAFIKFSQAKAMADCDVDAPNLHIVTQMKQEAEKSDFIGSKKAKIDSSKCIGCGVCKEKCRFDAIYKENEIYKVKDYACEGCGVCEYVCSENAVVMEDDVAGELFLYSGENVFSTAKLKMGRGNSGKLVNSVKAAMIKSAPETDLAIIDGSPGVGCPVISSISGVDLVLIVAEPSLSGLSDMKRLIETAEILQTKIAVCVNKWNTSVENTKAIEVFCNENGIPFVGKVPYDKNASYAINSGMSIADINCEATDALKNIFNKTCDLIGISIKN